MKQPVNRELITDQMNALGLSERQVLARISLGQFAFREARLNGLLHGHINLRQASEMAGVLGVELADLLATTRSDEPGAPTDGPRTDAATLIPLLVAIPRLVDLGHLSRSLDWERARLRKAVEAVPAALEGTGLRLVQVGTSVKIQPTRPNDPNLRRRIGEVQSRTNGLNLAQARMLRRIMQGESVTQRQNSNVDKITLGALKNMGCIELDESSQWRITARTRAAFAVEG